MSVEELPPDLRELIRMANDAPPPVSDGALEERILERLQATLSPPTGGGGGSEPGPEPSPQEAVAGGGGTAATEALRPALLGLTFLVGSASGVLGTLALYPPPEMEVATEPAAAPSSSEPDLPNAHPPPASVVPDAGSVAFSLPAPAAPSRVASEHVGRAPTPTPRVLLAPADGSLLEQARVALSRARPVDALEALDQHARQPGAERFSEERAALAIQALVGLGRVDEARRRAASFERRYPHSLFRGVIDVTLRGAQVTDRADPRQSPGRSPGRNRLGQDVGEPDELR